MVAGARRDDAATQPGIVQRAQAVQRAAQLEGTGALEQLELEPDLGRRAQGLRDDAGLPAPHRRAQHLAGEPGRCPAKFFEGRIGGRVGVRQSNRHGNLHSKRGEARRRRFSPGIAKHRPKPQLNDPGEFEWKRYRIPVGRRRRAPTCPPHRAASGLGLIGSASRRR
jgi:hypothetical protein